MHSKTKAIQAINLTKTFGKITAVDNLSIEVDKGEILGIVGPDGAGKTTLMRMLSTIMDPDAGVADVAGFNTVAAPFKVKENLAYMSQRFGLYPDLTVIENINFYADLYGVPRKNRESRIVELLGFSHMEPFRKRKARDLSGGMKQKLQLICALIHTPEVLLLDEPTNGVDPVSRRDFWRILYRIVKEGVSILVTTAYLDEAERCDRVGLLDKGKLLATGTPLEIKGLLKGRVLVVRSPDARKINWLIQEQWPGFNAAVFGDTLHIVCQDVSETRKKIFELTQGKKFTIHGMNEALPSLEDVFVSMMHRDTAMESQPESQVHPGDGHIPDSVLPGTAVEVEDLIRRFGNFTAVDRISFKVEKGEIFGFLGPNGAGKSTTIRMLCGLLSPSQGRGVVAGFDIFTQAEQIKQHIGYMSQKFSLYEDLTVEENIQFYGGIYGLKGAAMDKKKAWAMEMAGLKDHGKSLTRVLSSGWKQRLALACAILHEPPIIFLDEPTSGVDPLSRRRFWELIYAMADQGVTIFVTTHYMEEAEYCDRIALIYKGRMIAMGTPLDFKRDLKTRQMHGIRSDSESDFPGDVSQDLADLPGMEDVFISLIEEDDRKDQEIKKRGIDDQGMKGLEPRKKEPHA